jgi:hypothetical protein
MRKREALAHALGQALQEASNVCIHSTRRVREGSGPGARTDAGALTGKRRLQPGFSRIGLFWREPLLRPTPTNTDQFEFSIKGRNEAFVFVGVSCAESDM